MDFEQEREEDQDQVSLCPRMIADHRFQMEVWQITL